MTAVPQSDRRDVLRAAAAIPALGLARPATVQAAPIPALGLARPATVQAAPIPAKAGEFDFLTGEWRILHRREKALGEWDEFEGEATCWSILGGACHVEELRIPARDFSGLGLRTLDVEKGVWLDYWMNAKVGVPGSAGTPGRFVDGVGDFDAEAVEDGAPVIHRGCWDQITGNGHRWRQGVSRDGGRTWHWGWIMQWTRA